jgi:hypothetical protein
LKVLISNQPPKPPRSGRALSVFDLVADVLPVEANQSAVPPDLSRRNALVSRLIDSNAQDSAESCEGQHKRPKLILNGLRFRFMSISYGRWCYLTARLLPPTSPHALKTQRLFTAHYQVTDRAFLAFRTTRSSVPLFSAEDELVENAVEYA